MNYNYYSDNYDSRSYNSRSYNSRRNESSGTYLFLDFTDRRQKATKIKGTSILPLTDQFEALKSRYEISENYQEFLSSNFSNYIEDFYYIVIPNLTRETVKKRKGIAIDNIVIFKDYDKEHSLIISGDLFIGKFGEISVKTIDIIPIIKDKSKAYNVNCKVQIALSTKIINENEMPSYNVYPNANNSALTNDVINIITTDPNYYPLKNYGKAINTFVKWDEYIKFRNYYLDEACKKYYKVDSIEACNSYVINRRDYKKNKDEYSKYLYDDIKGLENKEQIILNKKVDESEEFPLIKVVIDKNKKEINENILRGKPKYQVELNKFSKDSVLLVDKLPKSAEDNDIFNKYALGERYDFNYIDILPDISDLQRNLDLSKQRIERELNSKYENIAQSKANEKLEIEKQTMKLEIEDEFRDYERDLRKDKVSTSDKLYQEEVRKINAYYDKLTKEAKAEHDKAIKALSNNKDSKQNNKKKDKKNNKKEQKTDEKQIEKLNAELEEKLNDLDKLRRSDIEKIDVNALFEAHISVKLKDKHKSLDLKLAKIIEERKEQLLKDFRKELSVDLKYEIKEQYSILDSQFELDKDQRIREKTIVRYNIYFKPYSSIVTYENISKNLRDADFNYLKFDDTAEITKLRRQENALINLRDGYVRNPFLLSYLFDPKDLTISESIDESSISWCLDSLNELQKKAVVKALNSESLFLLQGPPGTGKTQVIAEITAQYAKRGRKVLISSETHKAIDNVFDRLPKIPEIRPLRLIPQNKNGSKRENNYGPDKLVDNFYLNIRTLLDSRVKKYENYEDYTRSFQDKMKEINTLYEDILALQRKCQINESNINKNKEKLSNLFEKRDSVKEQLDPLTEKIDEVRREIKLAKEYRFSEKHQSKLQTCVNKISGFNSLDIDKVAKLMHLNLDDLAEELSKYDANNEIDKIEKEIKALNIGQYRNEYEEYPEVGDSNYDEYILARSKHKDLINRKNKLKNGGSSASIKDSTIYEIVPNIINYANPMDIIGDIKELKRYLNILVNSICNACNNEIEKYEPERNELLNQISSFEFEINKLKQIIDNLEHTEDQLEYNEKKNRVTRAIQDFFKDFDINAEYNDIGEAITLMQSHWRSIYWTYNRHKEENDKKIPIYKEISRYLNSEELLEEDREKYTKVLFDSANVFGMTCTSRDTYGKKSSEEFIKYNIEDLDIRAQGIDVVIIDEVSKSSFLDLIIPILYGKTVILVGDHKQLPPMYDLKHLREDDFDTLDPVIIDERKNREYTKLFEECYFKTLFESVPNDFKIMLRKQYRCHEHIMKVFNCFYGGDKEGLQLGEKDQNSKKEHYLSCTINNRNIITPNCHTLFVNCDDFESSSYEGSTSKQNVQEANVAVKLLHELNKSCGEALKKGVIRKDEAPSIGVICTYADQARCINNKKKGLKLENFSKQIDEKLVISTVDDFQGDERDIIIVSLVRNPENPVKADSTFIKKFERINVALSRSRKLLIVLGNANYLKNFGYIDLPGVGNNYPVYKNIIEQIRLNGNYVEAKEILVE